jgi:hypothetical protein
MKFEVGQIYRERIGGAGIKNTFKIIGIAHSVRAESVDVFITKEPKTPFERVETTLTIEWSMVNKQPFEVSAEQFEKTVREDLELVGEHKTDWESVESVEGRKGSSKRAHAQQRDMDKKAREEFAKALESL